MTGASSIDFDRPNPTGEGGWLSNKAWASILETSRVLKSFHGFDTEFEQYINEWEQVYNSPIPQKKKTTWPGQWSNLTLFKRLIVLRLIRPDKVIAGIQKLIKNNSDLGRKFIQPPPFDLEKSFIESTNKTPIIFVLSPGADPIAELRKLAEKKRVRFISLSLGQGQSESA
mmetsp:Transcript_9721/g.9416  ORF Transcript_9721/g.9416 Transcript_9721/m.9416 type:complete len:171 (-) Transcript_9721:1715-2227(-)